MTRSRVLLIVTSTVLFGLALSVLSVESPANDVSPSVSPIEVSPEGAATPEIAATTHFRACATRSPRQFTQHLLLGVCDGPIATVNKYAEALHLTMYTDGKDEYTVYDLPKGIETGTERVVGSQAFASDAEKALEIQGLSTYYAQKFSCLDVAADSYDGAEYRTRIVTAMLNDRWYAIPRCRSSASFYQVADAMRTSDFKPRTTK